MSGKDRYPSDELRSLSSDRKLAKYTPPPFHKQTITAEQLSLVLGFSS